jgi:hypothetical protein
LAAVGIPVAAMSLAAATTLTGATPAVAACTDTVNPGCPSPTATPTDTSSPGEADALDNTGVLDDGSQDTYTPPAAALPQLQAKDNLSNGYTAALDAGQVHFTTLGATSDTGDEPGVNATTDTVTPQMCGPEPTCNTPSSYYLPGLASHKEGEGNSKKHWTCGPASTRNMVQTMTGTDYGEHQFELWEGTTTSGTSIGAISSTLNNHFGSWGGWKVYKPSSSSNLLSHVITDTLTYHQGVVSNVYTGYLSFFNGHYLRHFDMLYGWGSSGSTVRVNEEWDPVYIYGSASYQPYGRHAEATSHVYNAIHNSPTQGIVA